MGMGDWIMATGQVRELYARRKVPVLIVSPTGRPQWSEMFENNPKIIKMPIRKPHQRLVNAGGFRPYISGKTPTRWQWRQGQAKVGELFFSEIEQQWAATHAGGVMIEPNVKANGHENKAWPFERWQALVDRMKLDFVQCGVEGSRFLNGVRVVITPSFRHAAAALQVSKTFVGSEGGLMHAAAAVGKPSVILWSEFIDPTVTGYPLHRNIRHAGQSCGFRLPCAGCRRSMEAITVDEVARNLQEFV